jgi:probable F420-dependent oxidoreductase
MEIGVTFPRDGLGNDPAAMRDFAQAAESLGYGHIHAGDHVLGRPGLQDSGRPQIDPFLLFSHLAAVTSRIGFVAGVMVLPQRQTVLVAKQAAGLDVLSGGRLRLAFSVGWNAAEYEALNEDFHNRGKRMDEQIDVLRALWTQTSVDFAGRYHHVSGLALNPLPVQRPIPLSMAGYAESALRRVARLADGWFPHSPPGVAPGAGPEIVGPTLERLRGFVAEAGRDPGRFGINGSVRMLDSTPADWAKSVQEWRQAGATHVTVNAGASDRPAPGGYLDALRSFQQEVMAKLPEASGKPVR